MAIPRNINDARGDLIQLIFTFGTMVFTVGVMPVILLFGTGGTGNTDDYLKFAIYLGLGILGILILAVLKGAAFVRFTGFGKAAERVLSAFGGLNHDPESGFLGVVAPRFAKTIFGSQLLLATGTIIVFSSLIILAPDPIATSQQFIGQSAIPEIDFVPGALNRVGLSMFPAADAETIFVVAVASLLSSFVLIPFAGSSRNLKLTIYLFTFMAFVTFGGLIFHQVRYGAEDVSILAVLQFWALGGILTAITGSAVPFRVMHFLNNFIVAVDLYLSSDIITALLLVVIVLTVLVFLIALIARVIDLRRNPIPTDG